VAGLEARGEVVAMVEDNRALEALGAAIQEGRVVQDNIRKFVFYLFSCGLAGTLLFVGAAVSGWPVPMLMAQALWLSLVTAAFPALALTAEPAQPDVMHRPPRSLRAALSSPTFFRAILFYATLLAAATLFVVAWSRYAGIPAGRAITMNFMALALAQLLHLGNARDSGPVLSAKRATANAFALTAVGVALALQVLAVGTAPLRHVLHLEPLTSGDWVVVVLAGLMPAVAGQVLKSFRRDIAG
jgi:Ca2+-transporting ATPase